MVSVIILLILPLGRVSIKHNLTGISPEHNKLGGLENCLCYIPWQDAAVFGLGDIFFFYMKPGPYLHLKLGIVDTRISRPG